MKRRAFLRLMACAATAPLIGRAQPALAVPEPVKPARPYEVVRPHTVTVLDFQSEPMLAGGPDWVAPTPSGITINQAGIYLVSVQFTANTSGASAVGLLGPGGRAIAAQMGTASASSLSHIFLAKPGDHVTVQTTPGVSHYEAHAVRLG
jgi:hypothetical protein